MTSLDLLYERIRKLNTHPIEGADESPCQSPFEIYPTPPPAPIVPLIRNPPSSEEYRQFLLWKAQQYQQKEYQYQDRDQGDAVPSPTGPPPPFGDQFEPQQEEQRQPYPTAPLGGKPLHNETPSYGSSSLHVPSDISPLEPMVLTKSSIRAANSGRILFTITTGSAPDSVSSRSLLTVTRSIGGPPVGTIRFHSLSTSDVEVTVNGCTTKLKEDGLVSTSWSFRPSSILPSMLMERRGQKWWWFEGRENNTLLLATKKKNGLILARMQGDVLIFDPTEAPPPPPTILDEIVVTALAIMEIRKRSVEDTEVAGEVIGAVAGA